MVTAPVIHVVIIVEKNESVVYLKFHSKENI